MTDPFRPGDQLPGSLEAFGAGRGNEVVYWLPDHHALVAGDVLLGDERGTVRLCPESWLPAGTGHAELRKALRLLLELDVQRLVLSHGEPVLEGARPALRRLLAG